MFPALEASLVAAVVGRELVAVEEGGTVSRLEALQLVVLVALVGLPQVALVAVLRSVASV